MLASFCSEHQLELGSRLPNCSVQDCGVLSDGASGLGLRMSLVLIETIVRIAIIVTIVILIVTLIVIPTTRTSVLEFRLVELWD